MSFTADYGFRDAGIEAAAFEVFGGRRYPERGALDLRRFIRGFGFLLIVAGIAGYALGAFQLPEREYGEITVKTNPPGATIFVDGMHRGATPLRVSGLRPGTHQLRAVMPGYKGVVLQVEILPSRRDSLDWMLEPSLPEALHRQLALVPQAKMAGSGGRGVISATVRS